MDFSRYRKSPDEIKAYNEGFQASLEGKLITDNPYNSQDNLNYSWGKGFKNYNEAPSLWEDSVCAACGKAEVKNGKMAAHADDCPDK